MIFFYENALEKALNRFLVAVPHNSGTTFLSALIANYIKADIPYFHLADGFDGCDHTLSNQKLEYANLKNLSFVAPLHVRNSPSLLCSCTKYKINVVVMTRSIYDVIVSLKDRIRKYKHKVNDSSALVFAKTIPFHSKFSDEQLESYILKYAVPWYFSFYASWCCSTLNPALLKYEDLIVNPVVVLKKLFIHFNYNFDENCAYSAIEATKKSNTRLNKGIAGRGDLLRIKYSKDMGELASLYPLVNFDPLLRP